MPWREEVAATLLAWFPGQEFDGALAEVAVNLTNTGPRAGRQLVQVYLARGEGDVERPVRWLAGHAWRREPGGFTVEIGRSAGDVVTSCALG